VKDKVDDAIAATEAPDEGETITGEAILRDGRKMTFVLPHPFSADDFESAVVILLNARARSEAQVERDKVIVVPQKPTILRTDKRN
jgi:hypothetical protein